MSVTSTSGGRVVRQKKCRLRDKEAIEERSRMLFQKFCEGMEVPDLARVVGYSESWIYRMFKKMPHRVKIEIKRDVVQQKRIRLEDARELAYAGGLD
jgi:AraC-like DNA-binding protein